MPVNLAQTSATEAAHYFPTIQTAFWLQKTSPLVAKTRACRLYGRMSHRNESRQERLLAQTLTGGESREYLNTIRAGGSSNISGSF
jgi:hypothetical protein